MQRLHMHVVMLHYYLQVACKGNLYLEKLHST